MKREFPIAYRPPAADVPAYPICLVPTVAVASLDPLGAAP